jgi:hypothetical protein
MARISSPGAVWAISPAAAASGAGQAPVLIEDGPQPADLNRDAGFKHVVVVAVAVRAPVHASDHRFPVGDQELDVIDLMAAVVDRVDALRHAEPVQPVSRLPTLDDGRVGDDSNVHASRPLSSKRKYQVRPAQLVHLHHNPVPCRPDEAADQLEDARVLP